MLGEEVADEQSAKKGDECRRQGHPVSGQEG